MATSFAVTIGSRWITGQTPVPRLSRDVTAAAAASARNGSRNASTPWAASRRRATRCGGRWDVRVLGDPEGLEAAVFQGPRELVDADRVLGREDERADLHALPPQSGGVLLTRAPRAGASVAWRGDDRAISLTG